MAFEPNHGSLFPSLVLTKQKFKHLKKTSFPVIIWVFEIASHTTKLNTEEMEQHKSREEFIMKPPLSQRPELYGIYKRKKNKAALSNCVKSQIVWYFIRSNHKLGSSWHRKPHKLGNRKFREY